MKPDYINAERHTQRGIEIAPKMALKIATTAEYPEAPTLWKLVSGHSTLREGRRCVQLRIHERVNVKPNRNNPRQQRLSAQTASRAAKHLAEIFDTLIRVKLWRCPSTKI